MKKLLGLTLLASVALSGCSFLDLFNKNSSNSGNETDNSSNVDYDSGQNTIEDLTPTYSSISEIATALESGLSDEQKKTDLPSEHQSDVYSISEAGDYYFAGALSSAISVAKNSGNVHIYLDGVSLSVADSNAISSKSGSNVVITLIGSNSLTNTLGSKNKDKHLIDSEENLTINGSGSLTFNSTKSAIKVDKTFIGLGGTLNVTAVKHCVTADSIYLNGICINAISVGKDILHAESDYDEVETAPEFDFGKGFIFIANATINSTSVLGDALQADSFVYIKDGTYNFTTTPTWNNSYVAVENEEKGMFSVSTHQKVARDSVRQGQTYAVLEESVKGIKVGEIDYYLATDTEQTNELDVESDNYSVLIEGGTFNINTVDDSVHINSGSAIISGGAFTITTSDDGIHADNVLKISGTANINIQNSYEGIEAETIDISGGTTTITALDDGVNATNSNLTESQQKTICQINISGGRLDVTVNPNGDRDGIDSNGGLKMTGGTVISRGPNSSMAAPIDAANAIAVTGGTLIVVGKAPGSSGGFRGPGGGPGGGGPGGGGEEGTFSTSLTKTQSSSKGLSSGNHTVVIGNETTSYTNTYTYSGYTTVYASASATIN